MDSYIDEYMKQIVKDVKSIDGVLDATYMILTASVLLDFEIIDTISKIKKEVTNKVEHYLTVNHKFRKASYIYIIEINVIQSEMRKNGLKELL